MWGRVRRGYRDIDIKIGKMQKETIGFNSCLGAHPSSLCTPGDLCYGGILDIPHSFDPRLYSGITECSSVPGTQPWGDVLRTEVR